MSIIQFISNNSLSVTFSSRNLSKHKIAAQNINQDIMFERRNVFFFFFFFFFNFLFFFFFFFFFCVGIIFSNNIRKLYRWICSHLYSEVSVHGCEQTLFCQEGCFEYTTNLHDCEGASVLWRHKVKALLLVNSVPQSPQWGLVCKANLLVHLGLSCCRGTWGKWFA